MISGIKNKKAKILSKMKETLYNVISGIKWKNKSIIFSKDEGNPIIMGFQENENIKFWIFKRWGKPYYNGISGNPIIMGFQE